MSDLVIKAKATTRGYQNCPVGVALPAGASLPGGALALQDPTGALVPAQVVRTDQVAALHWIIPSLARGEERVYRLVSAPPAAAGVGEGVVLKAAADQVDVSIDGERFTSYWHGAKWFRPFLHPLTGPSGAVTRRWPMEEAEGERRDHPHHKGCWVAWGDVNGTDDWADMEKSGRVKHRELATVEGGSVLGRLVAHNDWVSNGGEKLMEETREYRFHRLPTAARVFDLSVTFHATECDVRFGDTKEGGLCSIRVATSMDASAAGTIVNAYGGTMEGETWGKRAPWCDYFGPVNGKLAGVAIMDHPLNLRYPTYWHVRNYGLMTANPFGLSHFYNDPARDGSITLPRGRKLTWHYRVYVHAGDTAAARVDAQFHGYINPPALTVG